MRQTVEKCSESLVSSYPHWSVELRMNHLRYEGNEPCSEVREISCFCCEIDVILSYGCSWHVASCDSDEDCRLLNFNVQEQKRLCGDLVAKTSIDAENVHAMLSILKGFACPCAAAVKRA
ncbi:hypothetical protein AVEN_158663-1 [Araneus ventricosus]|uniref:Uncharacterized protein n=1 Tax=Araneus ventricosus TaxID=182803 RepID=A0A4Y2UW42_ARAVE|nr:hypothetical protein AVEN_158663-1 [Araneus ventricosus]